MPRTAPPRHRDYTDRVERLAYSPGEAAAALGVSRNVIYNLFRTGELPRHKVGGQIRIPAEALRSLVGATDDVV